MIKIIPQTFMNQTGTIIRSWAVQKNQGKIFIFYDKRDVEAFIFLIS